MFQTQRQGTINLGTARAGLVLAAAIAAAAVVGQLIAQNPISLPSVGSNSSVSTWQSDAGARREGSTHQVVPAAVAPADVPVWVKVRDEEVGPFAVQPASRSMAESSLYERLSGASDAGAPSTQTHNSGGGGHKGGFIPQ